MAAIYCNGLKEERCGKSHRQRDRHDEQKESRVCPEKPTIVGAKVSQ